MAAFWFAAPDYTALQPTNRQLLIKKMNAFLQFCHAAYTSALLQNLRTTYVQKTSFCNELNMNTLEIFKITFVRVASFAGYFTFYVKYLHND
jgi:hypothetical protein